MSEEREGGTGESVSTHVRGRMRILGIQSSTVAVDTLFIAAWVVVNWLLDYWIVEPMRLAGSDGFLLGVFRWVFGIATLIVVLLFVVEDIITMIIQARRRIIAQLREDQS
jgi:hypothetical protein